MADTAGVIPGSFVELASSSTSTDGQGRIQRTGQPGKNNALCRRRNHRLRKMGCLDASNMQTDPVIGPMGAGYPDQTKDFGDRLSFYNDSGKDDNHGEIVTTTLLYRL